MQGKGLILKFVFLIIILLVIFITVFSLSPQIRPDSGDERPSAYLLYTSSGSMLQLLNTDQIDAFIIWEPVVATTELSGIGKQIAASSDLPPKGKWADAASCILVLRKDVIEDYPEISALLSALTTAAIDYTNEEPEIAKSICAEWVFGSSTILTPNGYLYPLDVENESFSNMIFTADAEPVDSAVVGSILNDGETGVMYDPADMINPEVMAMGNEYLSGSSIPIRARSGEIPSFNIGYLPSSDNFAPLYVMVKNSSYFCERYGFCLVPDDGESRRPVHCTLFSGEEAIARINLLPGQSGGGLMTTIGQESLEGAYVGSVPAEMQIAFGNPSSIIQSINSGGTGLVVDTDDPCEDWDSFIIWIEERSAESSPVVIATVQSSIQEDMIREALACENIKLMTYGTDSEISYP